MISNIFSLQKYNFFYIRKSFGKKLAKISGDPADFNLWGERKHMLPVD